MRSNQLGTPRSWIALGVAPVSKGGTGASVGQTASANLGGMYSPLLGTASYATKSLSNGLVNPDELPDAAVKGPSLKGVNGLYPTQVVSYVITNYDSLSTYSCTVSAGSCVLNNDTITFTAPSAAQTVTLTVNGRSVSITVNDPWPLKPAIAVTTSGSNSLATAVMSSNTFAMVVGSLTHRSTDWEIASDSAFTKIVADNLSDPYNKLSWSFPGLALSSTYYARCRYRASNSVLSDWSDGVVFTTKSRYTPASEEAKIVASDKTANSNFGWSLDIDQDGTRVVVGAYLSAQGALLGNFGVAYIFKRTGTTWAQETKFDVSGLLAAGIRIGYAVAIDSTGTRVALGAPYASNGLTSQCGAVYIYVRSGTTWTQEKIIYASDLAANDNFGNAVDINGDGSRVIVGSPFADPNSTTNAGAVYIYTRTGTTWNGEVKIIAADKVANDNFGNAVVINSDATHVAVGSYLADPNSLTNSGAVYIYLRTGSTWALEQKLTAVDAKASDQFGYSLAITGDATRVVVGANQSTSSGVSTAGAVYVYLRSNTTWSLEYKLMAFDKVTADWFGTSVSINVTGDKVVVGSSQADPSGLANAGASYIFNRVSSIWVQETKLVASDVGAGDLYGCCVALSADGTRLAIGSYQEDPAGTSNAGSAYIYS